MPGFIIPLLSRSPARAGGARFAPGAALLAVVGLLASCDSAESPTDPFAGGGDRTQVVVISDIHLGADPAYSETVANRRPLVTFLDRVRVSPTVRELVIAGDLLDEWFVPATVATYGGGDQADFVRRIAAANPEVFEAFERIIRQGRIRVTYVPGNHDLGITAENVAAVLPGIHQARDAQGLGTYSPEGLPGIAIEHGHRYNFFCAPDPISNSVAAPGSILPPGYFFTRIAALHVVQHCTTPGDSVRTVTPNADGGASQEMAYAYWRLWKSLVLGLPIEDRLDDKVIVTGLGGFTQDYAVNDVVPFQATPGGFIGMNLFAGCLDTWEQRQAANHVAVPFPVAQALADAVPDAGTDIQATLQYFANPASDVRIVVFGHTHNALLSATENAASRKAIYANAGTWIDRNPGLTTMNFVVITPQDADERSLTEVKVYNFEDEVMTEMAADAVRL